MQTKMDGSVKGPVTPEMMQYFMKQLNMYKALYGGMLPEQPKQQEPNLLGEK